MADPSRHRPVGRRHAVHGGPQAHDLEAASAGGRVAREFALESVARDPAFLELLQSGAVETIHTMETTLEDVFVQVTGRPLA